MSARGIILGVGNGTPGTLIFARNLTGKDAALPALADIGFELDRYCGLISAFQENGGYLGQTWNCARLYDFGIWSSVS